MMLFNDIFFIENLLLLSILYFILSTNILMILITSGISLIFLGVLSLINDMDIYIGFLWIIDLGVGLVFFIFILHFTPFLYQKAQIKLYSRFSLYSIIFFLFILIYFYLNPTYIENYHSKDIFKSWIFNISYLDYYLISNLNEISELQTLKDSYFLLNNYEFFIINFSLFFGLISSIIMLFIIHRIFLFLNFNEIIHFNILKHSYNSNFIRQQNYIKQQNTFAAAEVWQKK
uniref:NADH dehydrogenase subunit 6 n=1 Tax=Strombidium cf. sulcatum TaxID=2793073 RepID=A0A7T0M4L0_9SPIT|nr:NADH dehydrogenase subunit 6 [Strombidium cf. sulcatum]QPL15929.1 NADH dehydrogenase subunit 6 [Strombidium cf. sulcatum]